jgi:hypothetical protein
MCSEKEKEASYFVWLFIYWALCKTFIRLLEISPILLLFLIEVSAPRLSVPVLSFGKLVFIFKVINDLLIAKP